ncbi:hypothetical protein [Pseudobdellovibrio exovorus]|uniref:Uncharacterized protein n=1 Tax=Pseudobdellovibrio exovorus JSS TaxID=1184267 RepID=M4VBJ4_9BACT|nr:hypothetical protein [Pseudobdellovibrio exovorus]AGH96767.1 hypothetical protein A11Q_2551 [Pseudobdellovibrio exovorus JSS]
MWSEIDKNYRLLNIVENDLLNPEAYQKFTVDFQNVLTSQDRLSNNYSPQSLDIDHHLMFHALYDQNDTFISCAGIYRRTAWPQNSYRLLNRTYYNPQIRTPQRFQFLGSDYILPHQLKVCNKPLDFIFVSRQGPFAANSLKQINKRAAFKNEFQVSDVFVQVVPSVVDPLSFQKILYLKQNPDAQIQFQCVRTLRDLQSSSIETITF